MRFIFLVLIIGVLASAENQVWVNSSRDTIEFNSYVLNEGDKTIADHYLDLYQKKGLDQSTLLAKTDYFSRTKQTPSLIDKEIQTLQQSYVFNASNRLLLFEYLKMEASMAKSLCHLYANDDNLKNSEPFFESSCALTRVSLVSINPVLTKFDYLLVDGNKIDIQGSPYFFTSGQVHQFIFISNRYQTQQATVSAAKLKTSAIVLTPWIEGTCGEDFKSKVELSEPVKIYFSKDCIQNEKKSGSAMMAYIGRNKYYILSGLLITLAALYVSSQYELGVSLP